MTSRTRYQQIVAIHGSLNPEVSTQVDAMDNSGNLGIWTFTRNDHEMTQTLDTAGNLPLILVKGTMAGMTKRMESVLKDCASRVGIIVRLAEPPGPSAVF